jgi:heat shock protein HslJ
MIKNQELLVLIILFSGLLFSCEKDKNEVIEDIYEEWKVIDFMSIESMLYAKNENYSPIIEFKRDSSFSLKLDVNNCFGSFEIKDGNKIVISQVGCTEMCCDSDFSNKLAVMLSQVTTYSFDNETLKLNVSGWGWISLKLK